MTKDELIKRYNAKEWKTSKGEVRYYINWKSVTDRDPVTASERQTKIWIGEDGSVNVDGKPSNKSYIKSLLDKETAE